MSSIRTSRTRLAGAAAAAVLASLALTACNDGTGVHDEGASAAASQPASSDASSAPSSDAQPGPDGSKPAANDPTSKTSEPKAPESNAAASTAATSRKPVTCEGSNTKTVAAPLNRPVNHMLLTVTNTGGKACFLYGYPALRFGEAQSVPPVIEDSQPQAVVTLQPGESGYASVNLSAADGSGSDGRTENKLTVWFQGRSGSESVGKPANPPLPAKGTYIDSSLKVTYWQQEMNDAVIW